MGLTDSQAPKWLPVGVHGGRVTENWDHLALHNGQIYRVGSYVTLGAGSTLSVTITTSTEENIHAQFSIETNGPGVGGFYEGTSASVGTTLTPNNANRNITTASTAVIKKDPTVTTTGSQIGVSVIGSEGFRSVQGGSAQSQTWIFKPSTTYMVRFTADNATCRTVIRMIYLED